MIFITVSDPYRSGRFALPGKLPPGGCGAKRHRSLSDVARSATCPIKEKDQENIFLVYRCTGTTATTLKNPQDGTSQVHVSQESPGGLLCRGLDGRATIPPFFET